METVIVLMSTYNGERYIRQQIDSILGQQGVGVTLLVRDDGSSDGTLNILNEYSNAGKLIYYSGENIGPARSFLHLLQHAPQSDYYAFADQDDVWMPDKLVAGVGTISMHAEKPSLYFCQTQLTDQDLNPLPSVIINPRLTFGEMLIYKFIGGCTMIMNRKLRHLIGLYIPTYMPMHDLWIYSIAIGVGGHIYFDPQPHILYRQHQNNSVGQGQGFIYEWKQRLKRFLSDGNERYNQAYELNKGYGDAITAEHKLLLQRFLDGKHNLMKRLSLITNSELRCPDKITQLLFWINVITNKY